MDKTLIRNVSLNGKICDILIEGNRFKTIAPKIEDASGAEVIDGTNMAIVPPFYNTHTHSAMTLLRSYADDLELFDWLQNYIWPLEAKMTAEDIYVGSRLAFLEMIKSGSVFCADMYWHQVETFRAAEEMGIRAAIGQTFLDAFETNEDVCKTNRALEKLRGTNERIEITLAPHAIYTVSKGKLLEIADKMKHEDYRLTIHAAETQMEVENCFKEHHVSPIVYLESLGLLGEHTTLAHCVHLFDDDIKSIQSSGSVIAHNPCSNMKLNSGLFRFQDCFDAGCKITIGTDGCASNNNVSMLEEMKFAALSAKRQASSPVAGKDQAIFDCATINGAKAFGIDGGVIEVGKLADALLINLRSHFLVSDYNLISNLVYSADSSCVDTVICNGKILMKNRQVKDEAAIIDDAIKCSHRLKKL